MDSLARTGLALFVLLGLHTIDHAVNQPSRTLPAGSGVIGIAGFALVAVGIVFALQRWPLAAPVGLFSGVGTFLGFVVVHMPGIGPLADPFADFHPNALSWVLLFAPMAVSLMVAYVAAEQLRNERPRTAPWPS